MEYPESLYRAAIYVLHSDLEDGLKEEVVMLLTRLAFSYLID